MLVFSLTSALYCLCGANIGAIGVCCAVEEFDYSRSLRQESLMYFHKCVIMFLQSVFWHRVTSRI